MISTWIRANWSSRNMSDYIHPLTSALEKHGNQTALVSNRANLTYRDLGEKVAQISGALQDRGVGLGDIVVLDNLAPTQMIPTLWAASICGAVAFPLNERFPLPALEERLGEISVKLVLSDRVFSKFTAITLNRLLAEHRSPMMGEAWDPHAATTLLMTSGSSGRSKIVAHSGRNHIASANGSNMNIELGPKDRWMLTLPLYHVGGLSITYRASIAGAAIVIPDPSQTLAENIRAYSVTHISLVATQLQRILDEPNGAETLKNMQAILLGGSAIPQALIDQALDAKLPIFLSYGSTEMASQICTTSEKDFRSGLANSGRILSGRDLIISHQGEILVKGPTLALGYLEGSEIKDLRDQNGWFHTGDVGYLEVDGALTVTGRMDNQFISGGENIQPEHIETTLLTVPGIEQAFVLPIQSKEFGNRPVALLHLSNASLNATDLNQALRQTLPGYMIPDQYLVLPDEFHDPELKVSRRELLQYLNDENNPLQAIQ